MTKRIVWAVLAALAAGFLGSGLPLLWTDDQGMDPAKARPAPEFPSSEPGAWVNSGPLTMASLRGRVVLLDVWTFG